jgi:acyl-CoA oxidase
MFLMTIQNLGNEAQNDKWGKLITDYRIHGCYAQTELGHGSNISVMNHVLIVIGN